MKVAILGGTRFIGPFMVRRLVEEGHEVSVCHRGKTAADVPDCVRHVTVDRDAGGEAARALARERPDAVIDMCGYRAEQIEEIIAAGLDLRQYVFCSSTAVYGRIGKATPGEMSAVKPASDYEVGKVACENLLMLAQLRTGFPVTILRLAHPYGPLDQLLDAAGRESLFLDRMRKGRPIVIPSAGDTRVHPIYVADAAEAFVHVLGRGDCVGQVFNLAGDEILTHDAYFGSIARALGVPLVAEHIPGEWFERNAGLWKGLARNFSFAAVWHKYESAFDVSALRAAGFRCRTDHDSGAAATTAWLDEQGLIPESSDEDLEDVVIRAWKRG